MLRRLVLLVTGALLLAALVAPAGAAAPPGPQGPTVYVGELTVEQLRQLAPLGLERHEVGLRRGSEPGRTAVELVLPRQQAAKLRALGLPLSEKQIGGQAVSERMGALAEQGHEVFRSYSQPGGIRDELVALSREHPRLTKLVTIGRTVQGQDILAVKVTREAGRLPDGVRPSVLYTSAQHAREWITPEMTRRLLRHVLEQYRTDPAVRRIVDRTELWFVPVANPDGYDHTFTDGNRLWRKNLRDNDGDGALTGLDGVDLNRNFPYRWGYDDEGSSSSIASDTYRGPEPASEPETKALDELMRRIGFEFQVNYHSAAELLLYGVGWQVATPSPDDLLYETLAGDDAAPAVPGYDPDVAAELYTTNGETTEHAHNTYGTLAFTPEMSTCQTVSAADPDDAFRPEECESVFSFPDSEALVQAEFAKNLPFALAVAGSAPHPGDPVSVVGRSAPDFDVDSFAVSYGDPQPVAVTARRDLRDLAMHVSVNGGPAVRGPVEEWEGGERSGDEGDRYYAEFRGTVRGARPGDSVEVWFTGSRPDGGPRTSERFRYHVQQDSGADVLVIADEDYEGVNPTYPDTVTAPKHLAAHVAAVTAAGHSAAVWDVSRQGVPHPLGVLGHFAAVVWYLGDNRLTQDPEDELTQFGDQELRDAAVAERANGLVLAVRDHLDEGGKLVHAGETAGYSGVLGAALGGIYYGLDGAPESDCVVTVDPRSDCLLLADDFFQYYLGAYSRSPASRPAGYTADGHLTGADAAFGGPALEGNPLDEPGSFTVTSDVLPAERFPQFASAAAGTYRGAAGGTFDPVEGDWYVGALHVDDSYTRLTRTVDLTGVTAAQAPALRAQLSYDTEEGYDHVIVEARPVGGDDWTTLPEAGGLSVPDVPVDCEQGFLVQEHPFLLHYLTAAPEGCRRTGTTGEWHAMSGSSGGWQSVEFDLSAYAGVPVEIAISYVTDPASGGVGVFVDDTAVVVDGLVRNREGFEAGPGPWSVTGPPPGSPPGGASLRRAEGLLFSAVTTEDSVLLGFGVEQVASAEERAAVVGRALAHLLGPRT